MFDIIFKDALIIDGSGNDPYTADLAVEGTRIAAIGDLQEAESAKTISCQGMVLAPGFIDIHSHGDLSIPAFPGMESCLFQGITTVFGGHCGMSASPAHKYWRHTFFEDPAFAEVIPPPSGGQIPGKGQILEVDALAPAFKKTFGFDLDWTHIGEYYDHLSREGIGANLVCVTGHGQIRQQVMGIDDKREATEVEIEEMKAYLREAMEHGSQGLSFGLDYEPGVYASEAELLAMAYCLREYDGTLTTHCQRRNFRRGIYKKQYYIDGLREVLEIAKKTGVRLHISHLACGYEVSPADADLENQAAKRTLDLIESYRHQGVRVTWDVIPEGCGGDMFHFPYLSTKLIPYVDQCGGLTQFSKKLTLGSFKRQLSEEIRAGNHRAISPFTNLNPLENPDWAQGAVITKSADPALMGKDIGQLAQQRGQHFVDTILDLLTEDPYICYAQQRPPHMPGNDYFLSRPEACVCLDGGVYSMDYPQAQDYPLEFAAPSTYCGMIKFLKTLLAKGASLTQTVAKMTGNSAKAIGLSDRGFIRQGFAADLVLLDLERLDPCENLIDPRQKPNGVEYVIVNGKIQAAHKECRQQKAGIPLGGN